MHLHPANALSHPQQTLLPASCCAPHTSHSNQFLSVLLRPAQWASPLQSGITAAAGGDPPHQSLLECFLELLLALVAAGGRGAARPLWAAGCLEVLQQLVDVATPSVQRLAEQLHGAMATHCKASKDGAWLESRVQIHRV
jgi:hypothetical protein